MDTDATEPQLRAVKLKQGKAIVIGNATIWLPDHYRSVTLLIAATEPVKHCQAPEKT